MLRTNSPWRQSIFAVALMLVAILLLYRDTAIAMVGIWSRSDTFAHAFLVPPISLWLIWRQRARLATLTPRAEPWVLLPLVAVVALWLLAELVVVNAAQQFAFVGLVVLVVPAMLGFEVALAILFPLLFLFFAVPFGEFMLLPMMNWTADFVVLALRATGVPVYREGLQFVIPTGHWSVIDECSGVRYLIASFMVGTLFAYLNYTSYKRRAVFMLVSLLVPIFANWMRAYIIVMMGHLSGNRLAVGIDHILYGWVFFGVVIFIMFMIGARWSQPFEVTSEASHQESGSSWPESSEARRLATCTLGGLVIALLPALMLWSLERSERATAPAQVDLPAALSSGWDAVEPAGPNWSPQWSNPSSKVQRTYAGPSGKVGVYLAYYRSQSPDRKLVSTQNGLVGINDREWTQRSTAPRTVKVGERVATLATAEITGPALPGSSRRRHLAVWQSYWIDGRFIAGDAAAKVAGALSRLQGRGDDGAVLVLSAAGDTAEASDAALAAFAAANLEQLQVILRRARDAR
ncbi:MAG: exosortase A [Burkholderiaceae bacterium]|nr:exosortase A [Burkholderiaceae bacterium]